MRKTTSNTQGCCILKLYCDTISMTMCETSFFESTLFPFDVGDHALSPIKSTSQRLRRVVRAKSLSKDKPPDWQCLQSILKEFRHGTIRIGKCKTIIVELNHSQGRSLTCFSQLKEHPPDKCRQNSKHTTYGNYLDSQKRMKPDLLSLGTGQAILRTQFVQRTEYDADNKLSIYQDQRLQVREETLLYQWTPLILTQTKAKECEHAKVSTYVFKDSFIPAPTDIIHLSLQKEPNIGTKAALKRKQRIQKWEEDHRFKPPDLDQNKHQDFSLFTLIKEEPPDTTSNPKKRLHIFRGKSLTLFEFMSNNLLYVHADNSDLRSNPSQDGGDDIRMAEQLEPDQGELGELGPEELKHAMEIPSGPITRAKAKLLEQAVSTLLISAESNLSPKANQTTLVVIQAD